MVAFCLDSNAFDDLQQVKARQGENGKGRQAEAFPEGDGVEAVGAGDEQRHHRAVADDGQALP